MENDPWITVQVDVRDKSREVVQVTPSVHARASKFSPLIRKRVAVLNLLDIGKYVPGLGLRDKLSSGCTYYRVDVSVNYYFKVWLPWRHKIYK